MAEDIQSFLSSEPYVKKNLFISAVLESIVKQLVDNQAFQVLVQILNFFSINELSNSNSAFYYAYAYAELNNERGFKLYNLILEKEPDNASVLNNIAVIYENKNEFIQDFFDVNEFVHVLLVCYPKYKVFSWDGKIIYQ